MSDIDVFNVPPVYTCSTRGCKTKTWRTINTDYVNKMLLSKEVKGKKHLYYCNKHKILNRQEYKGYVFILEAVDGTGTYVLNKLYEPNNPVPIRKGNIDLQVTVPMLMRTWTRGVDTLVKVGGAIA